MVESGLFGHGEFLMEEGAFELVMGQRRDEVHYQGDGVKDGVLEGNAVEREIHEVRAVSIRKDNLRLGKIGTGSSG